MGSHNPIPPQNRNSTIPASFKYPKHSAENEGRTLHSTAYPLDNRTDKSKQKESSRLRPLPHQGFGLGREWEGDCCGFRSGWPGESKRGGRFPSSCVLLMPRLLEWSWIWFEWRRWREERFCLRDHRERERPHWLWPLPISWVLAFDLYAIIIS